MKCPKCYIELTCGCSACRKNYPNRQYYMIITSPNSEKCPNCGLEMSPDQWLDIEWEQFKQ